MTDKIKLEYASDILYCKCAYVEDDWEERYKDNESVMSLISKLLSAESDEDEGIEEVMEELILEIGGDEEASLCNSGEFTFDGNTLEDEEDEEEEKGYMVYDGVLDFAGGWNDGISIYQSRIKSSKICVIEEAQYKHVASLEIDSPFDIDKLKYKNGWVEYDGESLESEVSKGSAIYRHLFVDGKTPGSLDYIAEVIDGCITIDKEYIDLVGFEEGTRFEIKVGRRGIRLEIETDEDEDDED